jgi:hypothetical protein
LLGGRKPDVRFQGHALPLPELRYCGADFASDLYFVQSAVEEAERPKDVLAWDRFLASWRSVRSWTNRDAPEAVQPC